MHKVKDGVYVINLDDKQSKRTHWISLFINWNTAAHFDSFGIEHNTAQEILHKNKIKEIYSLPVTIKKWQDNIEVLQRQIC